MGIRLIFFLLVSLLSTATAQPLDPARFHEMRSGLANSFHVFQTTQKGRVAFMGGSITEASGWRDSVCAYLQQLFPETRFEFINAGISSTGSTPGAFRFQRDVLKNGKVDLFFEEAAVNDPTNGFTGIYQIRGMEGIIRQALLSNPDMDIVLMHCVDPEKIAAYQSGKIPEVIRQHEKVAQRYKINTIHLAREVAERIQAGEFSWEKDFKDLHPSPFGHGVYAHSIRTFLKNAYERSKKSTAKPHPLPRMIDKFSYAGGRYVSVTQAAVGKGFTFVPSWVPTDKSPTRKQYVQVPALVGETPGDSLNFSFTGRAIGICITSGPDAGIIRYSIDGKYMGEKSLFTKWSRSLHLPWYVLLEDELPEGTHQVSITISDRKDGNSLGHAVRIQQFLVNE